MTLPQNSKSTKRLREFSNPTTPSLHLCVFAFIFVFLFISYKYHLPSNFGFPLWYFGALVVIFLETFLRQFMYESMHWFFYLGGARDGPRPTLDSIMNWHAILSPFLIFFMLEHALTNRSMKCLNDHCMCYCEIWIVEWVCACTDIIWEVWTT